MPQKLAVLASGGGTNLQAILDAIAEGRLDSEVVLVASNREGAGALDRARNSGVRAEWVQPGDDYNDLLLALLEEVEPDLVVLAGYLKLISVEMVRRFTGAMLNIHPALLPAFGGKGMYGIHVHEAVLERGVRVTGVTVHVVDEEYDRGPIVAQIPVPVLEGDTPERLQKRVLVQEHRLYAAVLQWFAEGRVKLDGRRVTLLPTSPDTA
ncbi:phosphoribosylglycinamide formyltransferase [Gemmatimonadota bacterium]